MDIETIIYIIFFIIFIVTRIFQGMKKQKENAPTINPPDPASEYSQPKREVAEKPKREFSEEPKGGFDDVFGDLMREIKKHQQPPPPESKPAYKPQPKRVAVKKPAMVITEAEGKRLMQQEGVSAFQKTQDAPHYSWQTEEDAIGAGYKKMMESDLTSTEDTSTFEFDPRRAFLLKTLLETKHF